VQEGEEEGKSANKQERGNGEKKKKGTGQEGSKKWEEAGAHGASRAREKQLSVERCRKPELVFLGPSL